MTTSAVAIIVSSGLFLSGPLGKFIDWSSALLWHSSERAARQNDLRRLEQQSREIEELHYELMALTRLVRQSHFKHNNNEIANGSDNAVANGSESDGDYIMVTL